MTQLEELHTTWAFYRQNRGDDCWAAALARLSQLRVLGLSGGIASEMLFSTLAGLSAFQKLSLRDVQVCAAQCGLLSQAASPLRHGCLSTIAMPHSFCALVAPLDSVVAKHDYVRRPR